MLQTIETSDGVVKRYSRPEDVAPATGAAAANVDARRSSCRHGCAPRRRPEAAADGLLRPPTRPKMTAAASERRIRSHARPRVAPRHAGASAAAIAARCRGRAPPRRRAELPRPQCRRLERWRTRGARDGVLALIEDARFAPVFARRQPRRGRDRRPAGAAGTAACAGFRANRPPGGDAERGADRRFQDQQAPPARRPRRRRPISASLRFTVRCCRSFIPKARSAPHYFGPKPLN